MDIKLKTLITNNSKLKLISLALFFLSVSICFEACFNLLFSFGNLYKISPIAKYIFFGPVERLPNFDIIYTMKALTFITGILSIIFFIIYRLNKDTDNNFLNNIFKLLSRFSIDSIFLFIISLFLIRYIFWSNTGSFYDNFLIIFDFIILCSLYFTYNSFKLYNENLKDRIIILKFIKNTLSKHEKKSFNKKLKLVFVSGIIIQFLLYFIFFAGWSDFAGGLVLAIVFSLFNILCYSYIYHFLSKKTDYINYLSTNIKNIESGNLEYKLDVVGNDEITSIASSINNLTDGLENALEEKLKSEKMKTELITNVSHDLKTPLTSIVSYIDILKNNELDLKTTKDYINILDRKATRLKTLVEDIFEASKINSGDIELFIEKTDVKELLIQSIVELEDKIEKSKLDFIINTPNDSVFANIDGKKTFRVFENLINNITKYSLYGTRVYIDLDTIDDNIIVTMKNISNHKLNISSNKLLERFVRGDISRNTDGSGLGLSISKNLVELQNGTLDLNIDGDLFKVVIKFKSINL